jgi:hypothetical protein
LAIKRIGWSRRLHECDLHDAFFSWPDAVFHLGAAQPL